MFSFLRISSNCRYTEAVVGQWPSSTSILKVQKLFDCQSKNDDSQPLSAHSKRLLIKLLPHPAPSSIKPCARRSAGSTSRRALRPPQIPWKDHILSLDKVAPQRRVHCYLVAHIGLKGCDILILHLLCDGRTNQAQKSPMRFGKSGTSLEVPIPSSPNWGPIKSSWWFQSNWKICSSNWIISPGRGENKKYLKPPPRNPNLQVVGTGSNFRKSPCGRGLPSSDSPPRMWSKPPSSLRSGLTIRSGLVAICGGLFPKMYYGNKSAT